MSGLEVLLIGVILGVLLVVIIRPQVLVLPPVVTQPSASGGAGCLLPLLLGLLLLGLLLFGGKPL